MPGTSASVVVSKHIFKGTKKYPEERVKGYKKKYDPSFLDVSKIFTLTSVRKAIFQHHEEERITTTKSKRVEKIMWKKDENVFERVQ